jgi:CheY-like chemotaxis protein
MLTDLPAAPPDRKPGVLVVDDEHVVRVLVQLALERSAYAVWVAASGWEAVRLYRRYRERIAVVLLDVCMPGLDGPETLAELRAINPDLRACFMTAYAGAYEPAELLRHGAACVIAKPFRLDDLTRTLGGLIPGAPARTGA